MAWASLHAMAHRLLGAVAARAGVEAGGGGRRWEGAPVLQRPPAMIEAARGLTRARAAALTLNSAYGNRIVESWATALAGSGWQARSRHPDAATRRYLNDAFEALANPALLMLVRAVVRDGEAFVQLTVGADSEFRLRHLPGEQIDAALTQPAADGGRIVSGIEFDTMEQVVAYHIMRDLSGAPFATAIDTRRIPAADMLHIFDPLFPGQVRGISWLAPALSKLRDRDDTSDAMLMREKIGSMLTGFITDPDGTAAGLGETTDDDGKIDVSLEPGAMRIIPPGADVKFTSPAAGLTQAVEFLRAQDREIAAGVGLTFEMLTGDLGEANYSSARVGLLDFRRRAEMLQRNLIEGQFLRPLWRRWIEWQALSGAIPADRLADYLAVRFVSPGWPWVDPRNDIQADVLAIEAGLKSREEVIATRGRDIDDVDEERARDRHAFEDKP